MLPQNINFREGQFEAVSESLNILNSKSTLFLNAPTGSGKSLINMLIGRGLGTAYITTPQVILVETTYRQDTSTGGKFEGLAGCVAGRRNYVCDWLNNNHAAEKIVPSPGEPPFTADGAPCTYRKVFKLMADGKKKKAPWPCPVRESGKCDYYNARDNAAYNDVSVTTLDYLLWGILSQTGTEDGIWSKRVALIVDEAHLLPDHLIDRFKVKIAFNSRMFDRNRMSFEKVYKECEAAASRGEVDDASVLMVGFLSEYWQDLHHTIGSREVDGNSDELKKLTRWSDAISRWIQALGVDVRWVVTSEFNNLIWRPITAAPFMSHYWDDFDKVIFASATFLNSETYYSDFLKEIGRSVDYGVVKMGDTFKPENAAVHLIGSTNMSFKKKLLPSGYPKMMQLLELIADKHKHTRGIIHCHSYAEGNPLKYILHYGSPSFLERCIEHTSDDRNEIYMDWLSNGSSNSILLSVGMEEGIDLKDDLARWQVIVKAPYAPWNDPWVQAKIETSGRLWYEYNALIKVLQASGRIVRSKDDYGETYILDYEAKRLILNHKSSLPEWFVRRLDGDGSIIQRPENAKQYI